MNSKLCFRSVINTLNTALLILVLLLSPLSQMALANPSVNNDEEIVARLTVGDAREMMRLVTSGVDLLEEREGSDLFIITTRAEVENMRGAGWRIEIDAEKTATLHNQQKTDTFNGGYRTVPEIQTHLQSLAARYPNLVELTTYGQSWQKINSGGTAGHDLIGVKLTNRQITGQKPTIFITATVHARELVPTEIALRFIDYLLNNYGVDGDATWLLNEHLIVVAPVANPDGRRLAEQGLFQRKNMNTSYGGNCSNPPTSSNQFGVDLNRNFAFKWGTINTPTEPKCGQTYPGPTAVSEPEDQGVTSIFTSLFPDQRGPLDTDPVPANATGVFIDLHSTGNLVMWAWAHVNTPPPNSAQLELIGRKLASFNGHTPFQANNLYLSSGSTRDYAYGELGVASFTFEIGSGSGSCGGFMPPYSCLDGGAGGDFWNKNRPALLYAARLARTPYATIQGASVENISATRTGAGVYELRATLNEQLNGGQNVAGAEYYIDVPPWRGGTPVAMTALDGNFDSVNEVAIANVTLPPGRHLLYVRGRDANGNWGGVRAVFTRPGTINIADFDGDGKSDISVFRPANGTWYSLNSSNNAVRAASFGVATDLITPGDYDGDSKADTAVFRNGNWILFNSSNNTVRVEPWGQTGDVPVSGDFDGDGKTDLAVFRSGVWAIQQSSNNQARIEQFGIGTDKPVSADYDGDGKTDVAVYRDGSWYLSRSTLGFTAVQFGIATDKPVVGDYDGDGKADPAVFRNGMWYLLRSQAGFTSAAFGIGTDITVPSDYDGDGKTDIAVYRDGNWYLQRSQAGFTAVSFGTATDKPVPSAFVP